MDLMKYVSSANPYAKFGSKDPVKSTTKKQKKSSVNPAEDAQAMLKRVVPTSGFMKQPVANVSKTAPQMADYYRKGGPMLTETVEGLFGETQVVNYQDPIPRMLADSTEESPASIRLFGKPNKDPNADDIDLLPPYTKFFLENVQEGHSERVQIVETFGDFYAFFFGEKPPIYSFSGTLLNADNVNWAEDFYYYYESFLRGTKCVEANARLILTYGFRQIEGFMMNVNFQTNAVSERGIPFSFQMLVINRNIMKLSLDFGLVESNGEFGKDTSLLNMLEKGSSKPLASTAYNDVKQVAENKKPAVEVAETYTKPEPQPETPEVAPPIPVAKDTFDEVRLAMATPVGNSYYDTNGRKITTITEKQYFDNTKDQGQYNPVFE